MKKIGILLALVFAVVLAFLWFPASAKNDKCAFCNQSVIDKQQYFEGEHVRVLVNYLPILTGHSLILPKRHVARFEDLTKEEFAEMGLTVKKVQKAFEKVYGTSDFLLLTQNGEKAGQTVFHVHFHMIPRVQKSYLTKAWLWWVMITRPFDPLFPVDWAEIEKQRFSLQEAISESSVAATELSV